MVRALQKKFIKAAMLAITLLILAIFIAINVFDIITTSNQLNSRMDQLCEFGGNRGSLTGEDNHGHSGEIGSVPRDFSENVPGGYSPDGDDADDQDDGDADDGDQDDGDADGDDQDDDLSENFAGRPGMPGAPDADLDSDDLPENERTDDFVRDFMNGSFKGTKSDRDVFLTSAFFVVRFDPDDNVVYTDISQIPSLTEENAAAIALEVYNSRKASGNAGDYMYRIIESDAGLGHTVVFLDTSLERSNVIQTGLISLGICVVSWLIMLALVIFLSKKAIRPIAENIERQKQFVTNAGHELKTPLAIIQSNTEAMELFNGENKWSINIKTQVTRLSHLTNNLLTLSRMDESADSMIMEDIDLSSLVSGQLQSFASSFEQKGVSVAEDIQKDIHYRGDKGQLTQLLNLLFDNAVKYTNENGRISVSLTKKGSKILFVSGNTCEALPKCPPDKLFDRFYRSDESRSQKTGGQGIGLSVVASIAENHGASISAEYSEADTSVTFTLKL